MRRLKEILKFVRWLVARGSARPETGDEHFCTTGDGALCFVRVQDSSPTDVHIFLSGRISVQDAECVRGEVTAAVHAHSEKNVVVNLKGVTYFDSSGAAILIELYQICTELKTTLTLAEVPPRVQTLLSAVDFEELAAQTGVLVPKEEPGLLVQIGEGSIGFKNNARDILVFIGAVVEAMARDLSRPTKLKWDRLWKLIERAGADAVPIATILGFLMGGVLAFQAAIQLRKFGANIFVADLVSLSVCLEMGPLMTSLIVSGRSGAGYAAQIGTMQVTEEVDALRVMGIDPMRYLVSPRIIAVAFAMPCLTLFADLLGILGGCLVAVFSLELTPVSYFNQVSQVLELTDVLKGLVKSFVFGIEIATIGCLRGFQVRGGAESVGTATTSAVVTCIFVLTVTDAIFAVMFYYAPALW